jgi:hypothetical protein
MNDLILFAHPTLGVLGIMASVWVLVDPTGILEGSSRSAAKAKDMM